MLEIKDLTVEIGGRTILNKVNLKVEQGSTTVLFGPNGAGKSALLMTLMGFSGYNVVGGQIIFKGEDITHLSVDERAKRGLGIMTQRPPNLTGVKLRDLVGAISTEDSFNTETMAKKLDMVRFMDRDVNVGFSGGEIKRSELLQLSAQNPCLYLLDEPESGVDLVSIEEIGKTIDELLASRSNCFVDHHKRGNSALIITHTGQVLDYVEPDMGYILCNGTVVCHGHPREILREIKSQGYGECITCRRRQL